jgi:hypothetical protein
MIKMKRKKRRKRSVCVLLCMREILTDRKRKRKRK